ncbi:hypothetical protein EVAR_80134_1 [Eumeta japonica]|uniref:Uncharacterized protein n=1 Tax=Eumeta variegata TaxID=151549 RepID=A0A4C1YH54_EUMVA|nr:hypothetical protein EVAR_80134_1 [Eumeta japonica]
MVGIALIRALNTLRRYPDERRGVSPRVLVTNDGRLKDEETSETIDTLIRARFQIDRIRSFVARRGQFDALRISRHKTLFILYPPMYDKRQLQLKCRRSKSIQPITRRDGGVVEAAR